MKSFKKYILEAENSDLFNSFVEKTLTENKIDANSANDFLNQDYNYQGIIYRVIFCPASEIENLFNEDKEPDRKAIAGYIVKYFNSNRYVFFSKSLRGILNLIKYPSLYSLSENLIGVVFAQRTSGSIDLTKYEGKNIEVKKRLEQTQEVLSFEDLTITNISALYYFGESGWEMETELNRPIILGNGAATDNNSEENDTNTEEEPEKQEPNAEPQIKYNSNVKK